MFSGDKLGAAQPPSSASPQPKGLNDGDRIRAASRISQSAANFLDGQLPLQFSSPSQLWALATTQIVLHWDAVLLPIAVFSPLRISGRTKPAYDRYPYPAVKVYDPYGHLEWVGKPEPFHR